MADYQRDFCLGRRLVTRVALKKLCWVWQLRFRSVPFGSLRFLPLKADRDQWTTKEMLLEDTFLTEMTCVLAKLRQMVFLASQISSWKPCQRLQNTLSESSELDNNSEGFRSIKVSASPLQVVKYPRFKSHLFGQCGSLCWKQNSHLSVGSILIMSSIDLHVLVPPNGPMVKIVQILIDICFQQPCLMPKPSFLDRAPFSSCGDTSPSLLL